MYSKGISWINDCRIPFVDEKDGEKKNERYKYSFLDNTKSYVNSDELNPDRFVLERQNRDYSSQGRFPANILVSDDMLNDGVVNGGGSYSGIKKRKRINHFTERGEQYGNAESPDNYGDKGSNSRYYNIDKWFNNLIDV